MQLGGRGSEMTEIRRECVDSIEPKMVPIGAFQSLQVAITYRPIDSGTGSTKTVLVGPPPGPEAIQLSVQPNNLLDALVAWKDATNESPSALLDRIERILRGRAMAGV
ncbi:hypothetical protein MBRA_25170 [Mycobacterium branderi]|uniref:DUF5753 domain-containing protein n=1 Tax=Mycobacterium branderi TaxID=43348 RepID=A0ABN6B786_9MYCO|nr:hypothetical protein MBRA_25170 [Mycobacterium branderi]